jgi:hypothetical protein
MMLWPSFGSRSLNIVTFSRNGLPLPGKMSANMPDWIGRPVNGSS